MWIIDEIFYRANNQTTFDNKSDGPVDEGLLEYIPEIKICNDSKIPADKKDCVICLEPLKVGDVAIMLACAHLFHKACILDWLRINNLCPICKYKVCKEDFGLN
jgi:E3 ubiquitin-protein ligase RNF115/126